MTAVNLIVISMLLAAQPAGQPDQTPKGGDAPAKKEQPAPARADAPPTVTLLEPGDEPRRELRLELAAGVSDEIETVMRRSVTTMAEGTAMPQTFPPVRTKMKVSVAKVHDSGDIACTWEILDVGLLDEPNASPALHNMMLPSLRTMVGMNGGAMISPRGVIKESNVQIPDRADPMVRQQAEGMRRTMSDFIVPLPAEPIGVGGKWQVNSTVESGGMTIQQVATYTLSSIEDSGIVVNVAIKQSADSQAITAPNLPPGAAKLNSMFGNGQGVSTLDLTRIAPKTATMNLAMDVSMTLSMGSGPPQTMQQRMEIKSTVSPAPKADEAEKEESPD